MRNIFKSGIKSKIILAALSAFMFLSVGFGAFSLMPKVAKAADAPSVTNITLDDAKKGVKFGNGSLPGEFTDSGYVMKKNEFGDYGNIGETINIGNAGAGVDNFGDFTLEIPFLNFFVYNQWCNFNIYFHTWDNINWGGHYLKFSMNEAEQKIITFGKTDGGGDSSASSVVYETQVANFPTDGATAAVFTMKIAVKDNYVAVFIDGERIFFSDKLPLGYGNVQISTWNAGATIGFPIKYTAYTAAATAQGCAALNAEMSGAHLFGSPLYDNTPAGNYDGTYYYVGGVKDNNYTTFTDNVNDAVAIKQNVKNFNMSLKMRLNLPNQWGTASIAFRATNNVDIVTGYFLMFKLDETGSNAIISIVTRENAWAYGDDGTVIASATVAASTINNKENDLRLAVYDNKAAVIINGVKVIVTDGLTTYNDAGKIIYNSRNVGLAWSAHPSMDADDMTLFVNDAVPTTVGKSVRLTNPSGLRFVFKVGAGYDNLASQYGAENVSFGAILIPTANISGELTIDTPLVEKISSTDASFNWFNLTEKTYSITLTGIPAAQNGLKITARSFVKIVDGEQTKYLYGNSMESSLSDVALSALNDVSDTLEGEYKNAVVIRGETKYSPYTDEKRTLLFEFAGVENYFENPLGEMSVSGGSIEVLPFEMKLVGSAWDAFAMSTIEVKDFTYSSDVKISSGLAAALVFKANADLSSFYCLTVDSGAGCVKLWKKVNGVVTDVKAYNAQILKDKFYNLQVSMAGDQIEVLLDGEFIMNATDDSIASGFVGLNSCNGTSSFKSIKLDSLATVALYGDAYRAQYHYSTADAWINDPNGLIYYNGTWHMYYQYIPKGGVAEHWGHATSTDLINWTEHGAVLYPEEDNKYGMWSGSATIAKAIRGEANNIVGFTKPDGTDEFMVLAYTRTNKWDLTQQDTCLAYSSDGGYTFTKFNNGAPVLDTEYSDFRDPKISWDDENQRWLQVIAGGEFRIYESTDLVNWTHVMDSGINTECPDFFEMTVEGTGEKKWILSCGGRHYIVGAFDGTTFTSETDSILYNEGADTYAGVTFANAPNGRRIMLSWLNTWPYAYSKGDWSGLKHEGWNGTMAIPVELKLVQDGSSYRLIQTPVEEIDCLKGETLLDITNQSFSGSDNPVEGVKSQTYELNAEINLTQTGDFTYSFCMNADGTDKTVLKFEKATGKITFDRSGNLYGFSKMTDTFVEENGTTWNLYEMYFNVNQNGVKNDVLKLKIIVDVNSVEIFINDGYQYFVGRMTPFSSSVNMAFDCSNGITFNKLTVNEMNGIWYQSTDSVYNVHVANPFTATVSVGESLNRDVYGYKISGDEVLSTTVIDSSIATATISNNVLTITGLKAGETKIKLAIGCAFKYVNVVVLATDGALINDFGALTASEGTSLTVGEKSITLSTQSGDGFAMSTAMGYAPIEISADVTFEGAAAVGLLFRATSDYRDFYCATLDKNANQIKVWKKDEGVATTLFTVSAGDGQLKLLDGGTYRLKVHCYDQHIVVYLNDVQVLDFYDNVWLEGDYYALNVYNGQASFANVIDYNAHNN